MADFTGMTVKCTLNDIKKSEVYGKVKNIVAGKNITLQDVFFPHDHSHADSYLVHGGVIADIQVVDASSIPAPPLPSAIKSSRGPQISRPGTASQRPPSQPLPQSTTQAPPPAAHIPFPPANGTPTPQRQPSNFVDPAILSYGRSPVQTKTAPKPPEPSTPAKSMLSKAAETLPNNSSPFIGEAGKSSGSHKAIKTQDVTQQAGNSRQASTPIVEKQDVQGIQETSQAEVGAKKKVRRGLKKKNTQDPPIVMNVEVSRNGNDMNGSVKRGKGWRQTPMLQPSPNASGSQTKDSVRKSRRQRNEEQEGKENGWATEEATDIQDLGDFDFEANHKLFDKKQVFDQLRQGDTTADEDRLVGHNRVHRPGTYGGKNLHPTENVLSPTLAPKYHSNELNSSSDADTELKFANGRSSSRHSVSRASIKKQPSRQNSALVDSKPHPLTASMSSDRGGLSRSVTSLSTKAARPDPSIGTSPRPDRTHSPHSAVSMTKTPIFQAPRLLEPHLAVYPHMAPCPILLPTALETLESETIQRFGLTQEAITESAARAIAETAMGLFDSASDSRRPSRANTLRGSTSSSLPVDRTTQPVVVIIAGNHAAGAQAVAAARHLVCRQAKIIVVEAQYESAETQDPQTKTQNAILKRLIKTGANIKRGPWRKAYNYIKNLSGPPAVIIDALLAGSTFESLLETPNTQHATESQASAREIIDWANRSRAPVLSIACPSGVSGADGTAPVFEGEPLAIRPDKLLSLAAPMQGVLEAMKSGEKWDVSLADIGINITLRSDEAVAFGSSWVVDLKFVEEDDMRNDG